MPEAKSKVEGSPLLKGGNCHTYDGISEPIKAENGKTIDANLGVKTIATFGSVALTVNNISGPGMLEFPTIFQSAGWVPCTVALGSVWFVSSICATFLCDTIARIPGNSHFDKRIEFSDIFRHFVGHRAFLFTQLIFYLCLLSQNIAAIVSTAQVIDSFFAVYLIGETYALDLSDGVEFTEWNEKNCDLDMIESGGCEPFADASMVITLGYLVALVLLFPLGLMNLDENIAAQNISFVALIILTLEFIRCFVVTGLDTSRVPAFGPVWHDCLGVVIFNYAFCVTLPSWLNEKTENVDVNQVIWGSTAGSTVVYGIVGWMGGMAFADAPDNILELLSSPAVGNTTRVCAALFGVLIIGLGIPVFCVLMRYNLVVGGVCSNRWATFWGAVFPWLISWLLFTGHGVLELLSWTGLILNGCIDFIAPMAVTLVAAYLERLVTNGHVRPTVVRVIPTSLMPYFDRIATGVGIFVVGLVLAGLMLKVSSAIGN